MELSIDVIQVLIGAVASLVAVFALRPAIFGYQIQKRGLNLSAYGSAIESIMALKQSFADRPEVFKKLLDETPHYYSHIPAGMKIEEFLSVVRAFWRLNYVYSVAESWQSLGMDKEEKHTLEAEVKAWLGFRTFRDVFFSHFTELHSLKPSFQAFIVQYYEDYPDGQPTKEVAFETDSSTPTDPPAFETRGIQNGRQSEG